MTILDIALCVALGALLVEILMPVCLLLLGALLGVSFDKTKKKGSGEKP
jgi:hypothetical protein